MREILLALAFILFGNQAMAEDELGKIKYISLHITVAPIAKWQRNILRKICPIRQLSRLVLINRGNVFIQKMRAKIQARQRGGHAAVLYGR